MPDIVDDRVTGALAELLELFPWLAIQWVLADPDRLAGLRAAADVGPCVNGPQHVLPTAIPRFIANYNDLRLCF